MTAILNPSAEYIIEGLRAGRSAMEIIQCFGYPRSTVYHVVAKYTTLEQSNDGSSMLARKSHSKERTAKELLQSLKGIKCWGRPRAIVAKISIDCWCKRANNASNYRGRPSI